MTITLTREEAQQVLDALDKVFDHNAWDCWQTAVDLLRDRLAQPEQEIDMKKYLASPNPWKLMP